MIISEALKSAAKKLDTGGVAEPSREAASLLDFVLKRGKAFLIAHPEFELSDNEIDEFDLAVSRRANREPFQYITGKQEFYGLEFTVTPDVLIPRPETEILVEEAIRTLKDHEIGHFCEIGVGSGCISVSILVNALHVSAAGLDISSEALNVARANAEAHDVAERLDLRISNIFSDLAVEHFDLIVSNPPYVPLAVFDMLQAEVRDFEPKTALTDGSDGLSIVRGIIDDAPKFLADKGVLLIEIGWDQSEKVAKMFDPSIWQHISFLPDLQGIPRAVKAKIR